MPNKILIEQPRDGSYSPPSPHISLLQAVSHATNEEFQSYCKKYNENQGGFTDEWKYNEKGECGNWQNKYIKLHKRNMAILKQYKKDEFSNKIKIKDRPKFVSYLCKEVPKNSNRGCGGLADRMGGKKKILERDGSFFANTLLGMISTFFYALLTDRAYLLNWAERNPLPLEAIWERPYIDWSHDPKEMELLFSNGENPLLGYQKVNLLNRKYDDLTATMFPNGGNTEFKDLWNETVKEKKNSKDYIYIS